jgi:predicted SAM-dependent methyltransferase
MTGGRLHNVGRRLSAARQAFWQPELTGLWPLNDAAERDRLRARAAQADEVRLHIGCGPRVLAGWLNVDLLFEPYENYLQYYGERFYGPSVRGERSDFFALDVTKGLPLPDDSVDVVFHEDFIEHLDQAATVGFLAETLRVLKPGAIHRVNTPDLAVSMAQHSDFRKGLEGVFEAEWSRHRHYNVMTPRYLEELATIVGYTTVDFNGRDRSAYPDLPPEYRPDPSDRPEDGNVFADLVK